VTGKQLSIQNIARILSLYRKQSENELQTCCRLRNRVKQLT